MRILMLAHRLPYPPTTGDKVRAYHVAAHLAREHELTLACLLDEPDTDAVAALRREIPDLECVTLRRTPRRLWAGLQLARGRSATMAYFASAALHARVAARLRAERFDLVYVSSSSMWPYAAAARQAAIVMDFVDVDSDKWRQIAARLPLHRRWAYRLEARRLAAVERAAARGASRSLVATAVEAALLGAVAPGRAITVVPNGVALEYFAPPARAADEPTIVFTGVMDYLPNVDAVTYFCRDVLPRVRARHPRARLLVVGKRPVASVRRLSDLPGVEVTGAVADVRPFLRRAAVAVAPLRVARGVQNKILEAMAMGLPVVATSTAHAGLQAIPGAQLLVEDSPAGFAGAVSRLLDAPALRRRIGDAGRAFVEAHHSWSASMAILDGVIADVAARVPIRAGGVR